MKVGDLRALLEERGMDSTGKKDLLVERLEAVRGKGGAAGLNTTASCFSETVTSRCTTQ